MELLIMLAARGGELVTREDIAERLWGQEIFDVVGYRINTSIRKIPRVLKDDPDHAHFVETVVGKVYRFAAPVTLGNGGSTPDQPQRHIQKTPASADLAMQRKEWPGRGWVLLGGIAVVAL